MNILIIGGGIGGPALATFLAKQGKSVTLVEKTPEWDNVGYGVTLWGIGRRILRNLGIDEQLAEVGHPASLCHLVAQDGSPIIDLDFKQFAPYGGELRIVLRTGLHRLILETMPPKVKVLLGTTVTDMYDTGNSVEVTFSNKATRKFDLVVGADGVHSLTRESLGMDDLTFLGWTAEAIWVPEHISCPKEVIAVSEAGRTLCFYPTKERTFLAIFTKHTRLRPENREHLIQPFLPYLRKHGWTKEDIVTITAPGYPKFRDELTYIKMGPWSKGRVVLLGDARHGFAPVIGMGANLALEDAQVLAEELGKVNVEEISKALDKYEKRRRPRINKVRRLSRFIELWFNAPNSAWFVTMRKIIVPIFGVGKWVLGQWIISVLKGKI